MLPGTVRPKRPVLEPQFRVTLTLGKNIWLFYIEKTTRLPDMNMGNNAKLGHFYNRKLGVLPNGLFLSILWVSICALLVEGSQ